MESSGQGLYNKIVQDLKLFDTDEEGVIIRTPYNISLINSIAGTFQEFINNPAYENRVLNLINAVPIIAAEVTREYQNKYGDIPDPIIQNAIKIVDRYTYTLGGVTDDQVVTSDLIVPLVNDLFFALGAGMLLDDTITISYNKLTAIFTDYYVTKVTTNLETFERELMLLYSNYFGVKRYRYVGPDDSRNRDFCSERVDQVFNETEIRAWAGEDWAGKIPSTDALNIFVNLGGYNCRHTLEPV